MPINNLEFAQVLTGELDKQFVQGAVTGFLTDNALRAKFVGAKTVLIPEMGLSGLGTYDRDNGFVRGSVSVSNKPFTLDMDRARSFQIDREDEDETGVANLAGQVMGEFVRTRVVPEVDAYCLSGLAGTAVTKGHTVTGTIASEAYKMLNTAITNCQNVAGFDEELVCFVNPTVWAAIQNSSEITRMLSVGDFTKGEINTKVKMLNGVAILPVSDARMKTAYDFHDGKTEGETDGGFAPTGTAKNIGFLVMPKKGASLIKKTEKVRTFSPDQNQAADAYKFDYRTYYGLIIKDSNEDAIYAYVY